MAKKPSKPAKKTNRKLKGSHRPKSRSAAAKRPSRKAAPAKRKQKLPTKKAVARKPVSRVQARGSSKGPRAAAPKGKLIKPGKPAALKTPPKAAKPAPKAASIVAKAPAKQVPARPGAPGVP